MAHLGSRHPPVHRSTTPSCVQCLVPSEWLLQQQLLTPLLPRLWIEEDIHPAEIDATHPDDNNDETSISRYPHMRARDAHPARVANGAVDNPSVHTYKAGNAREKMEKKKKGFLGSVHSMSDKLCAFCAGIFASLLAYVIYQMIQGSKMNIPWTVVFLLGGAIALICSVRVIMRASRFKDSESIDSFGTGSFKWLLLLVLQYLYLVFCTVLLLLVRANTTDWVPWPLVIIIITLVGAIALTGRWYWYFHIKWPKVMEEMNKWDV